MKIFVPKHVQGWAFNMTLSIWPFNVTIVQLIVIGLGVAMGLWTYQSITKSWGDQAIGIIFGAIPFLICIWVAFFKVSELTLIPFIAKMIRTNFLDTTKKFQVNYDRINPFDVDVAFLKSQESKQIVQTKTIEVKWGNMDLLKRTI